MDIAARINESSTFLLQTTQQFIKANSTQPLNHPLIKLDLITSCLGQGELGTHAYKITLKTLSTQDYHALASEYFTNVFLPKALYFLPIELSNNLVLQTLILCQSSIFYYHIPSGTTLPQIWRIWTFQSYLSLSLSRAHQSALIPFSPLLPHYVNYTSSKTSLMLFISGVACTREVMFAKGLSNPCI